MESLASNFLWEKWRLIERHRARFFRHHFSCSNFLVPRPNEHPHSMHLLGWCSNWKAFASLVHQDLKGGLVPSIFAGASLTMYQALVIDQLGNQQQFDQWSHLVQYQKESYWDRPVSSIYWNKSKTISSTHNQLGI